MASLALALLFCLRLACFCLFLALLQLHAAVQPLHAPFVPESKFTPSIEVFAEDDTNALGIQVGFGVVAVVGFIVGSQTNIARRNDKPLGFEVAYKVAVGKRIVAIAKVTVDAQAVVQQLTGKHCLKLYIGPSTLTGSEVGAKVPLVAIDNLRKGIAELTGQGRREDARHHVGVAGCLHIRSSIEFTNTKQVEDLHVHLLVGRDIVAHKRLNLVAFLWEIEAKLHFGRTELTGKVH